jgi:O-antigen/teichoic acid export membrane protein
VHWGRIFRNIFSSWSSYVITAVVGFVLAPVIVHGLGDAGYGLWTLVLSMTGYFGLLDLGIRSSVGRFVTRYIALNDDGLVNRTCSTAFVILGCGGLLAFVATVVIATFFFDSFRVEPSLASAGRLALLLTGLNISCILPLGVFSAVLIALERFDVLSGVTIVSELTRAAVVTWLLRHGYGLVALAAAALCLSLVQYAAIAILAGRFYPRLRLRLRFVDRATIRELFGFSIYRFIWIVAKQLIFYSDSLVIGVFLGAAAITPYAIAGTLVNYARNVVSLVTDTLSPAAARLDAQQDLEALRRLLILGTRLALFVTLPLCLGLLFLGRHFITLWMGSAYADSAVLLMVLVIPQFGSMSQYTSALVLAGMGKHRPFAYFALAEGAANLALSIILVQHLGLIGVAWGTVIPHLICTSIIVPLYTLRVLGMRVSEYLAAAFLRPVICALPAVALGWTFFRIETTSWPVFAGEALAMCCIFGVCSYFLCLDAGQRAVVIAKVASFLRREAVAREA